MNSGTGALRGDILGFINLQIFSQNMIWLVCKYFKFNI